jgi:hypothetical protein
VLLPGYSDELAYDLGLLDTDVSFEQTKRRARINYLAYLHHDDPQFSVKIRQRDTFGAPTTRLARQP